MIEKRVFKAGKKEGPKSETDKIKEKIARRCAMELKDGMIVNLGIGIPVEVPQYIPEGVNIEF